MPLHVSPAFRRATSAQQTGEKIVTLLTLTHPALIRPVTVADDVVDYVRDGVRYSGFPFEAELPGDTSGPPRAKLVIQNVDEEIETQIRAAQDSPRVKFEAMLASQFGEWDPEIDARPALGEVVVDVAASGLRLAKVSIDAMWVRADIMGVDYAQEPYPYFRATPDLCPALFR